MSAGDWIGRDLGTRTVAWDESDAILYALAVGARADQLDLVFEDRLRVLPTFALTLAQWAPDVLADAGAWQVGKALHGAQRLEMLSPLPSAGRTELTARVANVWDKGAAAIFDVEVRSEQFVATWSIFAPGEGGFGGERGPSSAPRSDDAPERMADVVLAPNAAALYRLTGDRHHIHIDPHAAAAIGQPGPIMQGLATLGAAVLPLAQLAGAHPADLVELSGRFSAVVLPGETMTVGTWPQGRFEVTAPQGVAIAAGHVRFA